MPVDKPEVVPTSTSGLTGNTFRYFENNPKPISYSITTSHAVYEQFQGRSQRGPLESKEFFLGVSCRSTKYGYVHSKTFKYFCVYTKRSGSRGGRGGVYGEPATVSDMSHQAPLRAISGYVPGSFDF